MEKKNLLYLVTVKVKTPEGYKPRVLTHKGIVVTENPKGREIAEQTALNVIEKFYKREYPKVNVKFHVAADLYNHTFFIDKTTKKKDEEHDNKTV